MAGRNLRLLQQRTASRRARLLLRLTLNLACTILLLVSVHLDPVVVRFVALRVPVSVLLLHGRGTCNTNIIRWSNPAPFGSNDCKVSQGRGGVIT